MSCLTSMEKRVFLLLLFFTSARRESLDSLGRAEQATYVGIDILGRASTYTNSNDTASSPLRDVFVPRGDEAIGYAEADIAVLRKAEQVLTRLADTGLRTITPEGAGLTAELTSLGQLRQPSADNPSRCLNSIDYLPKVSQLVRAYPYISEHLKNMFYAYSKFLVIFARITISGSMDLRDPMAQPVAQGLGEGAQKFMGYLGVTVGADDFMGHLQTDIASLLHISNERLGPPKGKSKASKKALAWLASSGLLLFRPQLRNRLSHDFATNLTSSDRPLDQYIPESPVDSTSAFISPVGQLVKSRRLAPPRASTHISRERRTTSNLTAATIAAAVTTLVARVALPHIQVPHNLQREIVEVVSRVTINALTNDIAPIMEAVFALSQPTTAMIEVAVREARRMHNSSRQDRAAAHLKKTMQHMNRSMKPPQAANINCVMVITDVIVTYLGLQASTAVHLPFLAQVLIAAPGMTLIREKLKRIADALSKGRATPPFLRRIEKESGEYFEEVVENFEGDNMLNQGEIMLNMFEQFLQNR